MEIPSVKTGHRQPDRSVPPWALAQAWVTQYIHGDDAEGCACAYVLLWSHKEMRVGEMEKTQSPASNSVAHWLYQQSVESWSSLFLPFLGGYYLTSAYGALSLIKNFQEEQAARLLSSEARDTLRQWHKRRTTNRSIPSVDDFQVCGCHGSAGPCCFLCPPGRQSWLADTRPRVPEVLSLSDHPAEKGYFKPPSGLVVSLPCFPYIKKIYVGLA